MKYVIILLLLFIFLNACKKDTKQESPQNALTGKWHVITDSSSITESLNGFDRTSNYIGTSSDYYDFTIDGKLFTHEAQEYDTATYTLLPNNNKVNILYTYIGGVYISGNVAQPHDITDLSLHHLTLTFPETSPSPEGYFHRVTYLQK